MPTKADFAKPLRIVLCCNRGSTSWGARVGQSLELTLFGDPNKNRTDRWEPLDLAAAIPLNEESEFKKFTAPPTSPENAGNFLDEALHTLVVVLVDYALMKEEALLNWLEACAACEGMQTARHQLFILLQGEEIKAAWRSQPGRPALKKYQILFDHELGEEAERVDWLGLRLLHAAIRLAIRGLNTPLNRKVRFFISHAKRDGLALARALRDLLGQTKWLEQFYDSWDLSSDGPWDRQLEEAVASSVLLALRTDNYDHRPWRRKSWARAATRMPACRMRTRLPSGMRRHGAASKGRQLAACTKPPRASTVTIGVPYSSAQ